MIIYCLLFFILLIAPSNVYSMSSIGHVYLNNVSDNGVTLIGMEDEQASIGNISVNNSNLTNNAVVAQINANKTRVGDISLNNSNVDNSRIVQINSNESSVDIPTTILGFTRFQFQVLYTVVSSLVFLSIGFLIKINTGLTKWLKKQGKIRSIKHLELITSGLLEAGGVTIFMNVSPIPLNPYQLLIAGCSVIAGLLITIVYDKPEKTKRKQDKKSH